MPALFSDDWMVDFGNAWNDDSELGDALAKIGFTSTIGYGFEGEAAPRTLRPGDYCELPARVRHRVEWTRADPPTVWLAVHWKSSVAAES